MRRAAAALGVLGVLAVAPASADASKVQPTAAAAPVVVSTVPGLKGVAIRVHNQTFVTDAKGEVTIPGQLLPGAAGPGGSERSGFPTDTRVSPVARPHGGVARFDRFYDGQIAMADWYRFEPRFIGIGGKPIDPKIVQGYQLKSRIGTVIKVKGAGPVTLKSSRVVRYSKRLLSKPIEWSIEKVMVDGANVVQRARIRFIPSRLRGAVDVPLLFFRARISSSDALFGFPIGKEVLLAYPSGRLRRVPLGPDGTVTLPALPRGEYQVKALAGGMSPERPVALSRNQIVDLKVVSWLDIGVAVALLGGIALALPLIGRGRVRRLLHIHSRAGEPAAADPDAAAEPEPAPLVPTGPVES